MEEIDTREVKLKEKISIKETGKYYNCEYKNQVCIAKVLFNYDENVLDRVVQLKSIMNDESHLSIRNKNISKFIGYFKTDNKLTYLFNSTNLLFLDDYIQFQLIKEPWSNRNVIINNISLGLNFLHSEDIIHGNLTPSNVTIQTYPRLKAIIMEPIIGKINKICTDNMNEDTEKDTMVYLAPELIDSPENENLITDKVDIYDLSLLMYHVCSLKAPYCEDKKEDIKTFKRAGYIKPVREMIPYQLEELIGLGINPNPKKRINISYILNCLEDQECQYKNWTFDDFIASFESNIFTIERLFNIEIEHIPDLNINKDITQTLKKIQNPSLFRQKFHAILDKNLSFRSDSYFHVDLCPEDESYLKLFLGDCYMVGNYVKEQETKAIQYYKLSSLQGNNEAKYKFGICNLFGIGTDKDVDKGILLVQDSCNEGNYLASYFLGKCYYFGKYLKRNYKQSVYYLQQAAYDDHYPSYFLLALCYFNGFGIDQNVDIAFDLMSKAAEEGVREAEYWLGIAYKIGVYIIPQDEKLASSWLEKAAYKKCPEAQLALGLCYYYGYGNCKNFKSAIDWLEKSGSNGNSEAHHILGEIHLNSNLNPKILEKAKEYFKRALKMENIASLNGIATCFLLNRDFAPAFKFFSSSAEFGDPIGMYNLALCYLTGYGTSINVQHSIYWLKKACKERIVEAQYNLASLYYCGYGTMSNSGKAIEYFKMASENGHLLSTSILANLAQSDRSDLQNYQALKKSYSKKPNLIDENGELGLVDSLRNISLMKRAPI